MHRPRLARQAQPRRGDFMIHPDRVNVKLDSPIRVVL
jgi:hypothetical protein